MTLPDSILFDATSMIKMHTASRRRLLEVTLAKFNVFVPVISIYKYLVSKAYINRKIENEFKVLKEIYSVLPLTDDIVIHGAKIEAKLLKKGLRLEVDDILTGTFAIKHRMLLVTADPERYKALTEFGLDLMDLDRFLKEVERMVEEELKA
ncbi:ribonuclease [Thermococcus profundus]|uniref:Ribonuclease n=1 Tax=Thermococcus profundus TaxID=49899 RepID=A0A2Z2MCZ3_THEPR|nr:type II toxin-antitoxin system VapC family toxin [Thermococcus profundus]ASJ03389.1 ribonuclease [Thermococcus profundus]